MIQENQRLLNQLNVISDGVLVLLSFLFGYWVRFYVLTGGTRSVPFRFYLAAACALVPLHLLTYSFANLYTPHRKVRLGSELRRLFFCNCLDFVILQMFLYLLRGTDFSRMAMALFFLAVNVTVGGKRMVVRTALHRFRASGYNQKHIVIVGSGDIARDCVRRIRQSPEFGYTLLGYVSDRKNWSALPYLGTFDQLDGYLSRTKPDEVIAGLGAEDYERMPLVIQACEHTGTKLSLIPFYAKYMPPHPQFDSLNGLPLINLRRIPLDNLGNAFMKRAMDIAGALVLIVLSSPVMLFAAIGVKLSSPGPIIFRQKRVGLNKKPFYMYKFRSMRVNAASDTGWSTNSDPRKTRFGSFIRKFSIDELPQFFNVLKGDMSLVGPRPELPHVVDQFKEEIPLYMVKHQVRPGITGWAQVNGLRGDTSIKERIEHDVYYIENWSILLDIKILFLTLFKGFVNQEKLN